MSLESAIVIVAINGDELSPKITESTKYKHWLTIEDLKRCLECAGHRGKIYLIDEAVGPEPPLHPNCRCHIEKMKPIQAGTATINGVDWSLKYDGKLPEYYISKSQANEKGWKSGKWLSNFAPNSMITQGVFYNSNGHLPQKDGRVWYEADINYKSGKRNKQRILWSNDGLIFVTYDHYETFYEII